MMPPQQSEKDYAAAESGLMVAQPHRRLFSPRKPLPTIRLFIT